MPFSVRSSWKLCLALALSSTLSLAQNAVSTGAITGTVHDSTGAVVSEVTVSAVNAATGVKVTTTTNPEGVFSFPSLQVGTYKASFSHAGFKTTQVQNISVGVGRTASAEAVLAVGGTDEQVVVEASATGVDVSDTMIGTLIQKNTIDGLPLSGRRYTDFVLLTPNVTTDGQFGHITFAGQSGGDLSGYNNTSGGASNANGTSAFTVDGSDSTSYYYGDNRGFTRIPYVFGLQSIQEFQVQPNVYNAAYGGAGAGFINTVTKSGTNKFHGDAFYYLRNSGTGANDAIDKGVGNPKLQNTLQQFGADIGGPVLRDKAFFYFDYEQQRHRDPMYAFFPGVKGINETDFGVPAGTALPTPNSHFPVAGTLTPAQAAADPTNPVYLQGVANALNVITTNIGARARRRDDIEFLPKFDWQVDEKDRINVLYNYNSFKSPGGIITFSPESFAGLEGLGNNSVRDHVALVHWVRTLSPNAINDAHISYVRDEQLYSPSGLVDPNAPEVQILPRGSYMGLGNFSFSYNNLREYQWQFADHVTYNLGKHQIETGFDLNHDAIANNNPGGFNGAYFFFSLTNFAVGKWDNFSQSAGNPKFNFSDPFYGFYLNDTYRMSKLTLSAGLREDFQVYGNPPGNPLPISQKFNNNYQRFSPRLGFSYAVTPKTVVRGGYGLYYALFVGGNYQNSTQTSGVGSQQANLSINDNTTTVAPVNQTVVFDGALPGNDPRFAAGSNITVISPNFKSPSIMNSNVQIEQEIAKHTVLTVGSMWSHGTHITSSTAYDLNLKQPTGTVTYTLPNGGTVVAPNLDANLLQEGAISSNFGQINALISPGTNQYVSFYTQLNRQVAQGLNVVASYTLAKSTQAGVDFYNQFDLSGTHGLSLLDQRQRLSVAMVYRPQVTLENHAAKLLLSDWTTSLLSQLNSGRPYSGLLNPSNRYVLNPATNEIDLVAGSRSGLINV